MSRGPIQIDGNQDFQPANGVVSGSGIADDPYVILGWEIVRPGITGIAIRNTDAHFVIRGLWVSEAPIFEYGIALDHVVNGTVENSWTISNFEWGIYITGSSNVSIVNNQVHSNPGGIWVADSSNVSIMENVIGGGSNAISVHRSSDVLIDGNTAQVLSAATFVLDDTIRTEVRTNYLTDGGGIAISKARDLLVQGNTIERHAGAGVSVWFARNVTLAANSIRETRIGIWMTTAWESRILDNLVSSNAEDGIQLSATTNTTLSGNEISGNDGPGLNLTSSMNVTLTRNYFSNDGVVFGGSVLEHFTSHEIDADNTFVGKPIRFYKNCSGPRIAERFPGQVIVINCQDVRISNGRVFDTDVGVTIAFSSGVVIEHVTVDLNSLDGIRIVGSTNLTIRDSNASHNGRGIALEGTDLALLENNTVTFDRVGLAMVSGTNTTVRDNRFMRNDVGVLLRQSSGNLLYHNDFVNNTVQAVDDSFGQNRWDAGYPEGGNYWSDYSGQDRCRGENQTDCTGPDGIGDAPYPIDSGVADLFPLMMAVSTPRETPPPSPFGVDLGAFSVMVVAGIATTGLVWWMRRRPRRSNSSRPPTLK